MQSPFWDSRWPLAEAIRAQRVAMRLTQQDLADLARVPRKTVSALESPAGGSAGAGFSWESLTRVLEALGMTITATPVTPPTLDDLLAENAQEESPPASPPARRVRRVKKADMGGPGHAP